MNDAHENDTNELLRCPSCEYTRDKHIAAMGRWGLNEEGWDRMKPISYEDRLLNQWVIECQNCGMVVLFGQSSENENIDLWNQLPRKTEGMAP